MIRDYNTHSKLHPWMLFGYINWIAFGWYFFLFKRLHPNYIQNAIQTASMDAFWILDWIAFECFFFYENCIQI